jgi:hypothetical protein
MAEGVRPRAMKARDAGKYIGVGRTKLKELIASGAFSGSYKIGRDHVVPVADLDAFVDAQAAAARAARSKAPFVRPAPGAPLISDASSHSGASIAAPPGEVYGPKGPKRCVDAPPVTSGMSAAQGRAQRPSSPTGRSSTPSSLSARPSQPTDVSERAGALADQVSQMRPTAKEHE